VPTGTSSDNELPTPVLVEKHLKKYPPEEPGNREQKK
jgi:hypothetical protein